MTHAHDHAHSADPKQSENDLPSELRARETERLRELLLDAEQRAAAVPTLQHRVAQLERELTVARAEAHEARGEARRLDQRLMDSEQVLVDVMNSPSWQVTKPLRQARKLLR